MGTWRSLVISMFVLVVIVAVWLSLVPRTERVEQPAVDAALTTRQVAHDTGTPLRLAHLGEEWRATSVRVEEPAEGVRILHVGYHRQPDSHQYVSITQTLRPTTAQAARAWITRQYGQGAGTVEAAGLVWTRVVTANPPRNVLVGPVGANPVIVITGVIGHQDLERIAATLQPVAQVMPASGSPVSSGTASSPS